MVFNKISMHFKVCKWKISFDVNLFLSSDHFRKYDYGKIENIKRYNSTTPPDYDLSKVVAATYIYHSKYDIMATPKVRIILRTYIWW